MSESYIPADDPGALSWMRAFRNGISANPSLYGVTPADATAIANAVNEFEYWMEFIEEPPNKNKVTVASKDDARTAAEQICRQFAVLIKFNSGISDPAKIAIGVRPVNPNRDPVFVPQVSPELTLVGSTPGSLTLHYSDPVTGKKKRPFGAANIQLFVAIADHVVVNPNEARFLGSFSRNPIGVLFQPEDNNKQATIYGRWASSKGEVGPWSLGVSYAIAA